MSDVDTSRRGLVESLGAVWVSPEDALDVDVLVPCAVGGVLTAGIAGDLRRAAVVGAANNQLDHDATADLLPARGVLRAPDPVVSAGGVIASVAREREGASAREAEERVRGIGARLGALLAASAGAGTTPLHETRRLVRELLPAA
ncbi:hypothetical protein KCV87_34115 [Actinosynnema pretiosum subsp. pretiosum]|uniref:Glutamate/phenylalanine/leucine/valine/L-tryptophan dehydrogenase C-terminal domain-containing protein n=1 Tax=Actinosynnema pretiosum subsp. pretiosum TaxID=103721 RepID=A0AA45R460_9PSEU|nr:hypothetical protein KCV87_34115 [Actinosynnema pretiosum subsp. pretiosum]